jgi:hypothetical protein
MSMDMSGGFDYPLVAFSARRPGVLLAILHRVDVAEYDTVLPAVMIR